jgi:cytochrome c5
VLCGRIADTTNPNHLPPVKHFNWETNAAFKAGGQNASAQSKGETVIRIMTSEGKRLGMGEEFLARHANYVMAGMNWLTSPADPSTNTPFSLALVHFQSIAHHLDNEARAREEEEAKQMRLERAQSKRAQFLAEEADRQARIRVTKECSSCHEKFEWYFPKGQDANSYVPVVKEGELNIDEFCKECVLLLCKHCKGAMCETLEQVKLGSCSTCMGITCKFCPQKVQKLDFIGVKVCEGCYPTRVCDCGQLVPSHNMMFKKCTTCNVCQFCKKALPSASEQTIRTCNECLMVLE